MTDEKQRLQKVATILRNWQGSDADDHASADKVAAEVDDAYAEYLAALPRRTRAIRIGRAAWERSVG
jgi:hypothetical protein